MPKETKERLQNKLSKKREEAAVGEARRKAAEFKTHTAEVYDCTLNSMFVSVILFKHSNKNKENYQLALDCFIHALSLISESNEGGEGIFPNRVKDQIEFISNFEGKTIDLQTRNGNTEFQVPQNILRILDTVIVDIKEKQKDLGSNLELLMNGKDQTKIKKHVDAKKSSRRRRAKASHAKTQGNPEPKPLPELPDEALRRLGDIILGIEKTFFQAYTTTPPGKLERPSGGLEHPSISRSQSSPELSK